MKLQPEEVRNSKPIMTAELVYTVERGRQRIYRLSTPITTGVNGPIKPSLDDARKRVHEKWKYLVPEGIWSWNIICISDAHTHTERLAFLGVIVGPNHSGPLIHDLIDGKNTFMTRGGSSDDVYPDKVYLRHLAAINHLKFGGIINAKDS